MPALFAYLLAITVALGGGYAGLRWLAGPDSSTGQHSSASAKLPNKGKKLPETPDFNVTRMTEAESGPKDNDKTEITAGTAPSGVSNKVAPETSRNEPDVPTGGCTPIGITASGKLVFPMQCQAFLAPHRGPEDFQVPVSTDPPESAAPLESAAPPKERQAAEPAPAADENTGPNRDGSSRTEAYAKVEDVSPSGEVKAGKASPEPEGLKRKRVGKRSIRSSRSKPVMMIWRTVEFPDGHLEERLVPMNRSRRTALPPEDQWFDPLPFR